MDRIIYEIEVDTIPAAGQNTLASTPHLLSGHSSVPRSLI